MRDFTAMAIFVHVVEQGGFTAAARHIGEPLSTVSRRISKLEQSLGTRLFERSTRSVRLTELGEGYYEFCRRGLEEFEGANLLIQNRQSEVAGFLSVSVPPSLAEPFFAPLAIAFQDDYPNARIAIRGTERHVDLIGESTDLAFRVGELKSSGLISRKIATYDDYLVAAPDYISKRPALDSLRGLPEHRTVAFGTDRSPSTWTLRHSSPSPPQEPESISIIPDLLFNDMAAVRAATLAGAGIARIPAILCSQALNSGDLVRVLEDWSFEPVSISALNLGTKNMPRLVRLFLDYCTEVLPVAFRDATRSAHGEEATAKSK